MNKYIKYPLVLGLVALVSGTLLAGTYEFTKDRIEAGKIDRQTCAINDLFTKIDNKELVDVPDEFKSKGITTIVKVTNSGKVYNCYTITIKDSVGGDEISLIIALDSGAKVHGVKIVSGDTYLAKYNNSDYLASVEKNNKFDTISGATLTGGDLNEALKLAIDCFKGNTTGDPIEEIFTSMSNKEEVILPSTVDSKISKLYRITNDGKIYYLFDTSFNDTISKDLLNVLFALNEDGSLYKVKVVEGDSWAKKYDGSTTLDVLSGATYSGNDLNDVLTLVKATLEEVK